MANRDDKTARLQAAIDLIAAQDAPELLAQAREDARSRVRSLLTDAITDSLLDAVRQQSQPAPSGALEVPPQPLSSSSGEQGWYVYGVVAAEAAAAGGDLSALCEDAVAAIVTRVPLEEFGEAQLRAHLADMEWVKRTAYAHERTLDAIRSRATVIPMRMCTVYRTEGGVREMLRREAAALVQALEELDGKTEWGVKVFADAERVHALAAATEEDDTEPASGAAYMQRQRRERDAAEQEAQLIEAAAGQIHERLCAVAVDGLLAPPQRPEASGHPGMMALNGVYLVQDERTESFDQEVRRLAREFESQGFELELTGPWPAFNFVPGTIGAAW